MKNENLRMNEPRFYEKDYSGVQAYSLLDRLYMEREIVLQGEIDGDQAGSIDNQIACLVRKSSDPIVIRINSPGGSVIAGMHIIDALRLSGVEIVTVAAGRVASMASVIFACGDRRIAYPSAEIMIHDPLIQNASGSALQFMDTAERLMETRKKIAKLLSERCGKSMDEILECTKKEKTFTAEEAAAFGLATEIADRLY